MVVSSHELVSHALQACLEPQEVLHHRDVDDSRFAEASADSLSGVTVTQKVCLIEVVGVALQFSLSGNGCGGKYLPPVFQPCTICHPVSV